MFALRRLPQVLGQLKLESVEMRKPKRDVELDDLMDGLVDEDSDVLASALKIHLVLEAILIEAIRLFRTDEKIFKMSFPQKTELLLNESFINVYQKQAFDRVNDFRNDFAHILGHRVTMSDLLSLARDLDALGIDFSDSLETYSEADAERYFDGPLTVLRDVGKYILVEAAFVLSEHGGRDICA